MYLQRILRKLISESGCGHFQRIGLDGLAAKQMIRQKYIKMLVFVKEILMRIS